MSTLKNISNGPEDLATGRVLAPGETAKVDLTDHERRKVDEGRLLLIDSRGRDQSARVKSEEK